MIEKKNIIMIERIYFYLNYHLLLPSNERRKEENRVQTPTNSYKKQIVMKGWI